MKPKTATPTYPKRKYIKRTPNACPEAAMMWIKKNPQLAKAVLQTFTNVK